MNKEFYSRKIQELSDDKLKELLQLRTKDNSEIINLAEEEALKRGIDITSIQSKAKNQTTKKSETDKEFSWTNFLAYFLPEP